MFNFGGGSCANLLLNSFLKSGRFSQAYLFCGDEFVGKRAVARKFAMAIFCCGGKEVPCFECEFCRKFLSGNCVDFCELSSGEFFKLGGVCVQQIRQLVLDAFVKPVERPYKIFLIDRVDELLPAAANAILKLLEEPPKHVIFLLTARSRFNVLQTIASRCVLVNVFGEGVNACFKLLKEHYSNQFDYSKLLQAAKFGRGSFEQAKLILTDVQWQTALEVALGLLEAYVYKNELKFLQFVAKIEGNSNLVFVVFNFFGIGLNLFLVKRIKMKKQVNLVFLEEIQKVLQSFEHVKFLISRNVNLKLALTELCCCVFPK